VIFEKVMLYYSKTGGFTSVVNLLIFVQIHFAIEIYLG